MTQMPIRRVGWLVGSSVCHNFLKGGGFTSMLNGAPFSFEDRLTSFRQELGCPATRRT